MIVRGAIGHRLAADVALTACAFQPSAAECARGCGRAIDAYDSAPGVRESFRDIGSFFAVGR